MNFAPAVTLRSSEKGSTPSVYRLPRRRGFTLPELMVAVLLFTTATVCLLVALVQSYRISVQVKYANEARYALTTITELFMNTPFQQRDTPVLFRVTGTEPDGSLRVSSEGMVWDEPVGVFRLPDDDDVPVVDPLGLQFQLGGMDDATMAIVDPRITRSVFVLNPGDEVPLLEGKFTITYRIGTKSYSQSLSAIRAAL